MYQSAHKNTKNPPGQIKYELTLSDYIDRVAKEDEVKKKVSEKPKLTFEQWAKGKNLYDYESMRAGWIAGQENI
jgi:hypothetical protein